MDRQKFLRLMGLAGLALMVTVLPGVINLAYGNAGPAGVTFYNNSPILQKFVDPLPGLNSPTAPGGQFIPIAIPDTGTYPGSDYYVIGLQDYTQQLHSGLPKATKLRGYYQINTGGSGGRLAALSGTSDHRPQVRSH
ncbi:MAG: hypothetical protein ABIG94_08880 [Pseudomonadota bacterium]